MEDLLLKVNEVLEHEESDIRPLDKNDQPGGLVLLKQDLPTIVVPDLHGRYDYLVDLLSFEIEGQTILDLLKKERIQVVCVGDGMHSERRGLDRWRTALEEYKNGFDHCPAMAEEMTENFQTMAIIMKLKTGFPTLFHFLKGNHENIMDEEINGNHPFAKLAAEGPMTKKYVEKFFGADFLKTYDRFEKNLPLMARGCFFIISHARPKMHYTIDNIINYRFHPDLVEGLTWTRHSVAKSGVIPQMLRDMFGDTTNECFWVSGHTAIRDLYNFMNEEKLLEIHNPGLRSLVYIDPNQTFDPEQHIHLLPKPEKKTVGSVPLD